MMVVDIWFLYYFIWMNLVCFADGGSIKMSYTLSQGYPDFYKDETLNVTCTASGYSGKLESLGVVSRTEGDEFDQPLAGCAIGAGNRWASTNKLTGLGLTGPTVNSQCNSIGDFSGFSVSAAGPVSKDKLTSNVVLQCAVYNGSAWTYSTKSIKDITIKEGPTNLKLTTEDQVEDQVDGQVEGQGFSMFCNATRAVPPSTYRYVATRKDDSKEVFNSNTSNYYRLTKDDKGGLVVKCIDESHPRWKIQDVQATLTYYPQYLECKNGSKVLNEYLNPSSVDDITCECSGNPSPDFQWKWNGTDVTNEKSSTLTLSGGTDKTVDKITCTASLSTNAVDPIITTWIVNWTHNAPTTTPTPRPCSWIDYFSCQCPEYYFCVWFVIIPLLVGVVIAVIVHHYCKRRYGYLCCKKSCGNNENNKPNELSEMGESGQRLVRPTQTSSSKSNDKKEPKKKAPGPPTMATPSEDDKIIYAELDHSTPIQRATAPGSEEQYSLINKPRHQKPQPPAESVEYAAIDFLKTGNPHSNNVTQPQNPPNPQPEALYSNTPDTGQPATGQPANQQHGARPPVASTRVVPGKQTPPSMRYENY